MRRRSPRFAACAAAWFGAAAPLSHAATTTSPSAAADAAALSATLAAASVAEDDRATAVSQIDAARTIVTDAESGADAATHRALEAVRRKLDAAALRVGAADSSDASVVASIRAAVAAAHGAARALRTSADGPTLREVGGGAGFHRRRARVVFDVVGCADAPAVSVAAASTNAALRTFEPRVTQLPHGRFRVTLGPDLGGAIVTATACGATLTWALFDEGAPGALREKPPAAPQYASTSVSLRSGAAAAVAAPTPAARAETFDVAPALPSGLTLDRKSGAISGRATTASPAADFVVVARNRRGAATTTLSIQVTPTLPPEMVALEDGFVASAVQRSLAVPVKMAFAPDGRLFFNELQTGSTRILAADGTLVAQPFSSVPVLSDGDRGLLGIALAPDFAASGHVFVFAATPGDGVLPDRSRVLRFTETNGVGTDMTVIVDSLPVGPSQNGGVIAFGPDGKLYVTVGDTTNPSLAQTDGSRAGRILRYEPDGSIPADNPIAGDPEWCRGLRNCFGFAFNATTGGLFAGDNGPATDDEIDFILPGKNYEWGAAPESIPGPQIGLKMMDWPTVIVPTGIGFLAKGAFGADYATSLFVAGYDQADLRRLVLSGTYLSDVDAELPFARWDDAGGVANKPLDVKEAPDGSLYVSTFTAIWRISRY